MQPNIRTISLAALTGLSVLAANTARANNITTSTGSLTGNTGTTVLVQCNVSWENSWRINPDKWDAAWLFVKYRRSDGIWRHASLSNTGHVAPSGSIITTGLVSPASAFNATTNPGVGVFLYRSADGSGTFSATGVQLLWNYSVNGVALSDVLEVRVFGLEMVNVATGPFAAGSGGTEINAFTLTTISTSTATFPPTGVGSLGGQAGGYPTGQTAPVNGWPNGFNAFYCMKYELSQQGYVDFLNTLTYDQQAGRTRLAPSSIANNFALVQGNSLANQMRNGVVIQTSGVASSTPAVYACNLNLNGVFGEATEGKELACNYITWGDNAAYLDWSGLRIMTELEFEKACRGTNVPVANEYPWGNTTISGGNNYGLANAGTTSEGISSNYSTTAGNAVFGYSLPSSGLLRVGIFAANAFNNGRVSAGAGFYGIMELAGNVGERIVDLANAQSRTYTGTHGNGFLATNGDNDVSSWSSSGLTVRGGAWHLIAGDLRVSDRMWCSGGNFLGDQAVGSRGVRTQ